MRTQLSAIILAAGASSRMGYPKALLTLPEQTVLEKVVHLYLSAGVSDIRVVTGHFRKQMQSVLQNLPVLEIYNSRHQDGMYSSIQCGIASTDPELSGFFIHPVDFPLVRPETIRILSGSIPDGRDQIICPVFTGKRGHPPLIGSSFKTAILEKERPDGLRGLFIEYAYAIVQIMVDDPGVRLNMNTPAEYQEMLSQLNHPVVDTHGEGE